MLEMSARTRWVVLGAGLATSAILVARFVLNVTGTVFSRDVEKRHVVRRGDTLTLLPDQVGPHDRYECPGNGAVNGTPDPGDGVTSSNGISVETALDGTVTVSCEPGPPGNV